MLFSHLGGGKILRNNCGVLRADKNDYRWMIHWIHLSLMPQISYTSMQCTLSYPVALMSFLITSSHQRTNPPSGFNPWRFITKCLYAFFFLSCLSQGHLILLHSVALVILFDECLWGRRIWKELVQVRLSVAAERPLQYKASLETALLWECRICRLHGDSCCRINGKCKFSLQQ